MTKCNVNVAPKCVVCCPYVGHTCVGHSWAEQNLSLFWSCKRVSLSFACLSPSAASVCVFMEKGRSLTTCAFILRYAAMCCLSVCVFLERNKD